VSARRLVIVLSGFPRRSETFALAEVSALRARGLIAAIFSTKAGEPGTPQPAARQLAPFVHRLDGTAVEQAAIAARILGDTYVTGVHAYFAHAPTDVASALAARLGVPFGFSVHARDARKVSPAALHARARAARCVIACNPDVAQEFHGSGAAIQVVPHGVDLSRFDSAPPVPSPAVRVLAVGRLVEKKGFHILLDALATLTLPWRLRLVGDGPEREPLAAQAHRLQIADRVSFAGALTHDELPREYSAADLVAVPSVRDRSGDCDGLPNVVLEAMASGRAIVATDIGAISSAIRDGSTGRIVPTGAVRALADAITALGAWPPLRAALGAAARREAADRFDVDRCTARLAHVLQEAYA